MAHSDFSDALHKTGGRVMRRRSSLLGPVVGAAQTLAKANQIGGG
jgi:hypothetical protein